MSLGAQALSAVSAWEGIDSRSPSSSTSDSLQIQVEAASAASAEAGLGGKIGKLLKGLGEALKGLAGPEKADAPEFEGKDHTPGPEDDDEDDPFGPGLDSGIGGGSSGCPQPSQYECNKECDKYFKGTCATSCKADPLDCGPWVECDSCSNS